MSKCNLQEKSGKISSIEVVSTKDNREMLRFVVKTTATMSFEDASKCANITDYMLALNERTEFSTLTPMIENVNIEDITKAFVGKECDIVVAKATIKELSNGDYERVTYYTKNNEPKVTSTMSRTYLKGSTNISEDVAFLAMKDDLRTRLIDGSFEPFVEKAQQKPAPQKPAINF